jgi:hypothetical protein
MQIPVKPFALSLLLLAGAATIVAGTTALAAPKAKKVALVSLPAAAPVDGKMMVYDNLHLNLLSLSREAFNYAMQGYKSLQQKGQLTNDDVLTIVDFSMPSSQKRLFVIDITNGKLLFNTYVSHGRNSGTEMATRFSNRPESFQSSLGFYVTGNTYRGQHGYSLKLEGVEKGINDNALMRKIVIHGAPYVCEGAISQKGYIGRSLGCPAVPDKLHTAIINAMRDGSCLFLYSPDAAYLAHTKILNQSKFMVNDTLIAG